MFGELVAAYLFLGGTGGGACAVAGVLGMLADRDDVRRGLRARFRDERGRVYVSFFGFALAAALGALLVWPGLGLVGLALPLCAEVLAARGGLARSGPRADALVFGSFARGDFAETSDVDVRLEFDKTAPFSLFEVAQFQKHLERRLGRSVEVITAKNLKNPNLATAIEREKVLVYERES